MSFLASFLKSFLARLQQQGGLIAQGFRARLGPVTRFLVRAERAQLIQCPLHGRIGRAQASPWGRLARRRA